MIHCHIKGCQEFMSETFTPAAEQKRWAVIKQEDWPNLDWWAHGGVDKVYLCPGHKLDVAAAVMVERSLDPSMNAGGQGRFDSGNKS